MKMVYTNENGILVNNAKNMLVNEGISISVKNEHVSTRAHPHLAYMEVWIKNESDFAKATKILTVLNTNSPLEEWICSECGEKNDPSFELCWNCRSEL